MKLLLPELGSDVARVLWESADELRSSRLTYVEARAALARARRTGRLAEADVADAGVSLATRWRQVDVVELSEAVASAAGTFAEEAQLRASDAVQLASAWAVADDELLFVTWDDNLRRAATAAGLDAIP